MNRRSFLKFAGLAPIVPTIAIKALQSTESILPPYLAGNWTEAYSINVDSVEDFTYSGYLRIENDMPIEYRIHDWPKRRTIFYGVIS